jgi:hypothetical protein
MDLKARLQKQTEKKGGSYWKPAVGKNTVTLLPTENEEGLPWILFKQHYIDGKYSICPGDGCPLCKKGWDIYNANGKKISDEAKKWLPQSKAALNVLVGGELKVWVISENMLKQILDVNDDIFNVEDGRDLIVTRTGDGLQTKYNLSAGLEKRTIDNWDEIEKKAPSLTETIKGEDAFDEELRKSLNF